MDTSPQRRFEKLIRQASRSEHAWRVFADFSEMATISISNAIIKNEEREQRYLQLIRHYDKDIQQLFSEMLGAVIEALEQEPSPDFLGEMFHALEIHNQRRGQFFTPMDVCRMMAEMTIGEELEERIERKGFITFYEPACGAGAMVIAIAGALKARGINFQKCMHVTAVDIDPLAAHMAYIQLSLLGIPARVFIGNSLSLEMREVFHTPMHMLGLWDNRLRRRDRDENQARELPAADSEEKADQADVIVKDGQYQLFEPAAD